MLKTDGMLVCIDYAYAYVYSSIPRYKAFRGLTCAGMLLYTFFSVRQAEC